MALEKGSLDVWGRSQRQASVKRCGRRGLLPIQEQNVGIFRLLVHGAHVMVSNLQQSRSPQRTADDFSVVQNEQYLCSMRQIKSAGKEMTSSVKFPA